MYRGLRLLTGCFLTVGIAPPSMCKLTYLTMLLAIERTPYLFDFAFIVTHLSACESAVTAYLLVTSSFVACAAPFLICDGALIFRDYLTFFDQVFCLLEPGDNITSIKAMPMRLGGWIIRPKMFPLRSPADRDDVI